MCGGPGLYGYIALNKSPSGTRGGENAVSSTGAGKVSSPHNILNHLLFRAFHNLCRNAVFPVAPSANLFDFLP